jgi:serine/threonine protein kinase
MGIFPPVRMNISSENWKRLSPLLDEALDLAPAERARWIGSLGPEHDDLRATLQEILLGRNLIETGDFMRPLPALISAALPELTIAAGDSIGPYRLIRELGAGGTAVVWLAERADGGLQRRVAIKFPHLGFIDRGLAARVTRERDILAGLEHPNIARLYDAGVDAKGRPYLVLEYIDGVPPDQYCEAHALTLRQRLELFLRIARTVGFAHARLIVHRDLKPNNILVVAGGDVRLLDFGVARLLSGEGSGALNQTQVGARVLTPAYAAPEQFTGQPITVATDVYSLGIVLFELLTARTPYSPARATLAAMEEAVLRDEPRLASRTVPAHDARAFRGDLDAVLAKALRKNPDERYASVEAFAADIERHLAGLPIAARPQSLGYVARKFARRHALPLSLTILVACALTASLGVAAWQWQQATQQRQVAIDRLASSQASDDFVSAILMERLQPGETVSFEELAARSEEMATEAGRNDVRTRIVATDFLANWYSANDFDTKAEALLTHTIDSLPASDARLGSLLRCRRALLWQYFGRGVAAREELTREIARTADDPATQSQCLTARAWLALALHDGPGALDYVLAAQKASRLAGVESAYYKAEILELIARAHALAHRSDLAQRAYRDALNVFADAGLQGSRAVTVVHRAWAAMALEVGNPRQAVEHMQTAIDIDKRLAPHVQESASTIATLARALIGLGKLDAAAEQYDLAARLAANRDGAATIAAIAIGQADIATARGQFAQAQSDLDAAATALHTGPLPAGHNVGARYLLAKASLSAARGDFTAAAAQSSGAIALYEQLDCCEGQRAFALALRAEILTKVGRLDEAAADATRAVEVAKIAQANEAFSLYTGRALRALALVRRAQGRERDASAAYEQAAEHLANTLGMAHPDTVQAREAAARLY